MADITLLGILLITIQLIIFLTFLNIVRGIPSYPIKVVIIIFSIFLPLILGIFIEITSKTLFLAPLFTSTILPTIIPITKNPEQPVIVQKKVMSALLCCITFSPLFTFGATCVLGYIFSFELVSLNGLIGLVFSQLGLIIITPLAYLISYNTLRSTTVSED